MVPAALLADEGYTSHIQRGVLEGHERVRAKAGFSWAVFSGTTTRPPLGLPSYKGQLQMSQGSFSKEGCGNDRRYREALASDNGSSSVHTTRGTRGGQ